MCRIGVVEFIAESYLLVGGECFAEPELLRTGGRLHSSAQRKMVFLMDRKVKSQCYANLLQRPLVIDPAVRGGLKRPASFGAFLNNPVVKRK